MPMNDLVSRSALLEKATNVTKYDEGGWSMDLRAVPVENVVKAPAVDAVEVVRCKNCIHSNDAGCATGFTWCDKYDCGVTDDFYCKTGERRPDHAD